MTSYHNTTNVEDTATYEARCHTQETYILDVFYIHPLGLTADEVVEYIFQAKKLSAMPFYDALSRAISIDKSVRRAMSNLQTAGQLIKTNQKRKGRSGRDNLVYVSR